MSNKISTCLWFDGQAENAARFYLSIFKNSRIIESNPMTTIFELDGHRYVGLNGGPMYQFSEAISLMITCETQEEVDWYWNKLIDGGSDGQCGWLKDRFGLSWQVIPTELGGMLHSPDREKADRALHAMLKMTKIDIAAMKRAFDGK